MKKYLSSLLIAIFVLVGFAVANNTLAAVDVITLNSVTASFTSVTMNGGVVAKSSLNPGTDFVSVNWGDGSATTTGVVISLTNPPKEGVWSASHVYPSSGTYIIKAFFGTASISTSTIVFADTIPPVIDEHPDILGVEATSPSGAVVNFTVNSTDNVDGIQPANCSPASGSTFALGTTTVDCNRTDSSGNVATTTDFLVEVVDTTPPIITVPAGTYVIPVFSTFTDPGATAEDIVDGDLTSSIISTDDVNTSILGSYTITYTVTDSHGNNATSTRPVSVVDEEDPIITLLGTSPVYVEVNTSYTDAGFTATDNVDGDLTASTTVVGLPVDVTTLGTTTITYDVTDSSGNPAVQQKREVIVQDTTSPIITLLGDNPTNLKVGDTYTEAGATATDNYDGDLTGSIITSGSVDTGTAGTYTITYNLADSSGNSATSTRTVNVRNLGTNSSLSDMSVSLGSLNSAFDSGVKNYTVVLPYGTTVTPTTYATATDPYAWMIQIDPAVNIISTSSSDRTTTVTVTAEDQISTSIYSIEFNVSTDITPPVITILGDNPVNVYKDDTYTDAGATATDDKDGDITSKITSTSTVNISEVGTYTVTYTVSDNGGNIASSTRTVNVERRSSGGGGSSGGSSSGGSTSGGSQTSTSGTNEAEDLANYLRFLNLLSVLGSETPGEAIPAPAIIPTGETTETVTGTEEGGATTTEGVTTPTPSEEGNVPLAAAVGTAGSTGFSWWWILVLAIIVSGLIYYYQKGRKNDQ